jgi:hypothetical protein
MNFGFAIGSVRLAEKMATADLRRLVSLICADQRNAVSDNQRLILP